MKSDYDKCPKDEPCVLISNPVTIRCSRKLVDRNGEYKASSGVENKVKEKLAI